MYQYSIVLALSNLDNQETKFIEQGFLLYSKKLLSVQVRYTETDQVSTSNTLLVFGLRKILSINFLFQK